MFGFFDPTLKKLAKAIVKAEKKGAHPSFTTDIGYKVAFPSDVDRLESMLGQGKQR